jgi:glutaredoxin
MKLILITRLGCTGCERLKAFLEKRGLPYRELDGLSAEGLTELRAAQCFPQYFPVLMVGGRAYEYASLFGEKGELLDLSEVLLSDKR